MNGIKKFLLKPVHRTGVVFCIIVICAFVANWDGWHTSKAVAAVALTGFVALFLFTMMAKEKQVGFWGMTLQVPCIIAYQLTGEFTALILFVVLCVQMPLYLPKRVVMLAFFVLVVEQYLVSRFWLNDTAPEYQTFFSASLGFFGIIETHLAHTLEQRAEALRRTNAELMATRTLMESGARNDERLRLSRELHDVAGHRLAALTLQMELALKLPKEQANDTIVQARNEAKALLDDIHAVVGQLRKHDAIALRPALERLIERIPQPRIELHMDDALDVTQLTHADVLIRCVQEAITNAIKHAHASHMRIQLTQDAERIHLHIKDNGRGTAKHNGGYGLKGMRERLQAIGGDLSIHTAPNQGFALDVSLPRATQP